MTGLLQNALILLILLQIKHTFADFYLQTPRMLAARDKYLHIGRAQHVGLHAVGSAIGLVLLGTALPFIVILVLAEALVHYHIDWGKGWYSAQNGQTSSDAAYWRAIGLDQALHQLTYVAMIWIWASYGLG